MALKRQHKTQSMFSMASMTDVIFLLLIFFLVTSTFVFPSALEVNLPQSSAQTPIKPNLRIWIDKDSKISVQEISETQQGEPKEMSLEDLKGFLNRLKGSKPSVALHAHEHVPYGLIVNVLDMGAEAGIKMVLATTPANGSYSPPTKSSQPAEALQEPAEASEPTTDNVQSNQPDDALMIGTAKVIPTNEGNTANTQTTVTEH